MMSQPDISFIILVDDASLQLNAAYLDTIISHFKQTGLSHEFVVTACSLNQDSKRLLDIHQKHTPSFVVVEIGQQRDYGYKIKRGCLESSGKTLIILQLKEWLTPEQIQETYHAFVDNNAEILFGSRQVKSEDESAEMAITGLWQRLFSFLMRKYISNNVKDPLCGLKMLKRVAAEAVLPRIYFEDAGFNLEVIYLAEKMGYMIDSVPVSSEQAKPVNLKFLVNICLKIFQIINWHCIPVNTQECNMSKDEFKSMYELENHHWWFVSLRLLVVGLVRSVGRSFPAILDVGSGTGGNMAVLSKIGNAYGIEISQDAIDLCKERGLENIAMSPVEAIKYPEESFDMITCINVLEHVYDPVKALREIKRVLNKDGKAIVVVPAFRMLWSQHDEALCHFRKFEKYSFLQDIEEAGLKTEKVGYFFFTSFFALAPLRIIKRLFSSNKKLETDTESLPPDIINRLLIFLFRLEAKLTKKITLPFGSSLYAVLSK